MVHRLLQRQIRKHLETKNLDPGVLGALEDFLNAVSQSYMDFDADHLLIERAMELSSQELFEANQQLQTNEQNLSRIIEEQTWDLRQAKEVAEKANCAKSMFLANMSHELRTPMHGILSFARFGQQKFATSPKEKLKTYFDEIYDSGQKLMILLNNLLNLSKLEAGRVDYQMAEHNLVKVIRSVAFEMSAFAEEKKLKISFECDLAEVLVRFDETGVGQVLRNLLSNAIKFSHPDTTICIQIQILAHSVSCQVINCGVGIPTEELESVFDEFVQSSKTRSGAGGTGLGLAISKRIIGAHLGKIWAQCQPDGTTTFSFEIPYSRP